MVDVKLVYLWLSNIFSAGSNTPERLLSSFPKDGNNNIDYESAAIALYECDENYLSTQNELTDAQKNGLSNKDLSQAEKISDWCEKNRVGIITPADKQYPQRLKSIINMPMVLYYKGTLPDFDSKLCIGVVGTRHPSEYGKRNCYTISYDLSRKGVVTVSGLALGCDSVSHRATLDSGGFTVAVLGCGIDVVYPPAHRELTEEIMNYGCVITEYAPGTLPERYNFPKRNRIISGLCSGVTVIEAPFMSGSLITADTALKQGRDVFALPGKVGEGNSEGTNDLIMNGAYPVHNANNIITHYYKLYKNVLKVDSFFPKPKKKQPNPNHISEQTEKATIPEPFTEKREKIIQPVKSENTDDFVPVNTASRAQIQAKLETLNDAQKKIYQAIADNSPLTIDEAARYTSLPVSQVSVSYTMLEIKKLIKVLPGGAAVPIQ